VKADPQELVAELVDWYGHWFEDDHALDAGRMTDELYPYDRLFSPIQVNGLKIKNRIVMGPMGNLSMAEETGRPSTKMIEYYVERARGGAGLITSGMVPVSFKVDPSFLEPGGLVYLPRLDGSRSVLAGWRDLAAGIHDYGARFFVQISPGAGRVGSPECLVKRWRLPVSSSWNPNFYMPSVPCRPLWDHECRALVRATGQAAADAQACLADGVYLHGYGGYLLEQFANPAFNRRPFGRFADPEALGLALVREIRRRCGPALPIMYRIDLSLALAEVYGERMDKVKSLRRFRGERAVEATLAYMQHLVAAPPAGANATWLFPGRGPPSEGAFRRTGGALQRRVRGAGGGRGQAGLSRPGRAGAAGRGLRPGHAGPAAAGRPVVAAQGLRRPGT
jgi:2-enoate reductase